MTSQEAPIGSDNVKPLMQYKHLDWCSFTKHTYLQITGRIQQNVAGLEVTVEYIGRVDILEPSQYLVDEVADMICT